MKTTILNHNEGVDLIPASLELSGVDVSLVNAIRKIKTAWADNLFRTSNEPCAAE